MQCMWRVETDDVVEEWNGYPEDYPGTYWSHPWGHVDTGVYEVYLDSDAITAEETERLFETDPSVITWKRVE